MKKGEHLPMYGVGPIYVYVIAAMTLAAVLMRDLPAFASGRLERAHTLLLVLGAILIAAGVALWVYAVPVSKIDDGIRKNRLVTTGAYALVRNPIYSAVLIACTGVLMIAGNAWFFVLPFVYWLFMTVLMKATEEKWLRDLYGKEYDEYCKRVNRCWPWFPKRL